MAAKEQLAAFQVDEPLLVGCDRFAVKPGGGLQRVDEANHSEVVIKDAQPEINIKGATPAGIPSTHLLQKLFVEKHGGLADEAALLEALRPDRWGLAGIDLQKVAMGIYVLAVAINHLPMRLLIKGLKGTF